MGNYISSYDVKVLAQVAYSDLGFNTDGDYEAWLDTVIPAIEALVEKYCSVPTGFFKAAGNTYTDERYDYDAEGIQLKNYPVLTMTKVEYNDQGYGIAENWVTVAGTDYILYGDEGILILTEDVPAIKERSVRVTYTAGYSAVPDVIAHVCAQTGANLIHTVLQQKVSPVVQISEFTVRTIFSDVFTPELKAMLTIYQRRQVDRG